MPNKAPPGSHVSIYVHVTLAAGWHIAPMGRPDGPTTPTQLSLKLPKGVSPIGDWQAPKPDRVYSGAGESRGYMGEVIFMHKFKIENGQAAGQVEISCEVIYQACNDRMCDRETKMTVGAKLDIIDEKSR